MYNAVEKVSNEGSRVTFFVVYNNCNKKQQANNSKQLQMPYHIMSQGTLKKRRLHLKIARLDLEYLTEYHHPCVPSAKVIKVQAIDLVATLRFSKLSQGILAQDGGAALYCFHQMAKAVACRRCVSLGLLQRLCV